MHFPALLRRHPPFLFLLVILFFTSPVRVFCQAIPVAQRTSELKAFGLYTYSNPDFGGHNSGAGTVFGADYMRRFNWLLTPGLEFRVRISPGPTVSQKTFGGGIRVEHPIRQFHPYADFLISHGSMSFSDPFFNPVGPYDKTDTSLVLTYGGGVDVSVFRQWGVRGDFQSERWTNFGNNLTLAPWSLSVGAVYHFQFGSR